MSPTLEFLMRQHEHVLESIKLADQKAAAITAISVGTIYLLYELMKAPCFAQWPWKCVAGLAQVLLLLSTGISLWSIDASVGITEGVVKGGEHAIPARAAQLSQADYEKWVLTAGEAEKAEELAALLYARIQIRAWKYERVHWSIRIMYGAYFLLLVLVGHFMVHSVRTRNAHTHGQAAPVQSPAGTTGPAKPA